MTSSDFDATRYKLPSEHYDVENTPPLPEVTDSSEDRYTPTPFDSSTIEISDAHIPLGDQSLEVLPVMADHLGDNRPLIETKQNSSSFEALYDSAQIDAVSGSLPLPSSDTDNRPILGDHFVGTFKNTDLTSSFEDLYRRTSCVGEVESESTPSIPESEMEKLATTSDEVNEQQTEKDLLSPATVMKKESSPVYHEWSEKRWSDPSHLVDPVEISLDELKPDAQYSDPDSDSVHSDTLKESIKEEYSTLTEVAEETTIDSGDVDKDLTDENFRDSRIFENLDILKSEEEISKEMVVPIASSVPQDIPANSFRSEISSQVKSRGEVKPESLGSSAQSEQSFHIGSERKHFFPSSSPDSPTVAQSSSSESSTRGSIQEDFTTGQDCVCQDGSANISTFQEHQMILLNLDDELLAEEEGSFEKSFEIKMEGSTFFPQLSQSTTPRTDSTCSPITRSSSDPKSEDDEVKQTNRLSLHTQSSSYDDTATTSSEPRGETGKRSRTSSSSSAKSVASNSSKASKGSVGSSRQSSGRSSKSNLEDELIQKATHVDATADEVVEQELLDEMVVKEVSEECGTDPGAGVVTDAKDVIREEDEDSD
jgi:hypothetical protein